MANEDNKPVESTGKDLSQARQGQFLNPLDEFEQWFDDIRRNWIQPFGFGRHWPEPGSVFGGRTPRVDVIDRESEFCVRAELPGISKEDLEVSLHDNSVTLRATTQKEEKEERGQYYRRELSRGEFQRTVRLPAPVESENAKATFKDGILELTLPKVPGFKRQTIKVE